MEYFGYISIFFVGLFLGLLGSGGSILILPILVYFLGINPIEGTTYSLLIVGLLSFFGMLPYIKKNELDFSIAIPFSIPSIIFVYLTRLFLLPYLPDVILNYPFFLTKDKFIMLIFSLFMCVAAAMMLLYKVKDSDKKKKNRFLILFNVLFEGAIIGVLTGFVGAGGGFLIIPALVLLLKVPIKKAIPCSLFIITAKSIIGVYGDLQNGFHLNYSFLFLIVSIGVIGVLWAQKIVHLYNEENLKKIFAIVVIFIASIIMGKEILI